MTHGWAFRFRWKTSALNKLYNNFSVAVIFQGEHDHELINYILTGLHNAWHTLEKTNAFLLPSKKAFRKHFPWQPKIKSQFFSFKAF